MTQMVGFEKFAQICETLPAFETPATLFRKNTIFYIEKTKSNSNLKIS